MCYYCPHVGVHRSTWDCCCDPYLFQWTIILPQLWWSMMVQWSLLSHTRPMPQSLLGIKKPMSNSAFFTLDQISSKCLDLYILSTETRILFASHCVLVSTMLGAGRVSGRTFRKTSIWSKRSSNVGFDSYCEVYFMILKLLFSMLINIKCIFSDGS